MKRVVLNAVALLAVLLFGSAALSAQTTEFSYQGNLNVSSAPANGNYDLEFALFSALTNGTQLGPTLTRSTVAVVNGTFSVKLDFGSQFPGDNRYLEIGVRQSGGGAFQLLTPRQQVNSAPYAIKSVNADNAANATNALQLGGVPANQYVLTGDARLSDARNPLPGSASYIQNQNAAPQPSSNFSISGDGTIGGGLRVGDSPPVGAKFSVGSSTGNALSVRSAASATAVIGTGGAFGVFGFGTNTGVSGLGGATGVSGTGDSYGVSGSSSSGVGVSGVGGTIGGSFDSNTGNGVQAHSTSGYGIFARSENTHAIYTEGSVRFNRWIQVDELRLGGGTTVCWNTAHELSSCASSSIRYKKNLADFEHGLDVVMRLRPITFHWKSDGTHDLGLVAEEVDKVAPQLTVHQDGRIEGVKYDKIGMVLINAVKEQQAEIEKLQTENQNLRKEVVDLRNRVSGQKEELSALKAIVCSVRPKAAACRP